MGMTGCSKATATRDLGDLVDKNCLYRMEGGGRNARYGIQLEEGSSISTKPKTKMENNIPENLAEKMTEWRKDNNKATLTEKPSSEPRIK